jgi:hypothetical protein
VNNTNNTLQISKSPQEDLPQVAVTLHNAHNNGHDTNTLMEIVSEDHRVVEQPAVKGRILLPLDMLLHNNTDVKR